jgi:hypothetical protein
MSDFVFDFDGMDVTVRRRYVDDDNEEQLVFIANIPYTDLQLLMLKIAADRDLA